MRSVYEELADRPWLKTKGGGTRCKCMHLKQRMERSLILKRFSARAMYDKQLTEASITSRHTAMMTIEHEQCLPYDRPFSSGTRFKREMCLSTC